jgi:transposase-like protein
MTREYTQADKDTAVRLYTENGWGYLKISQVIGCSRTAVRDWVLGAGIKPRPAAGYSDKFKTKVMNEYEKRDDLSLEKVAHKNGVGARTLSRWLHGAPDRKVRPYRPRVVDKEAIEADLKAGFSAPEAAERNHCTAGWVYQIQRGDG